MIIYILAGGKSERLGKRFSDIPKCLIKIYQERCSLDYCLNLIAKFRKRKIIINCSKNYKLFEFFIFKNKKRFSLLELSKEIKPLGTAGTISKFIKKNNTNRIVIIYGDTICRINIEKLIQFHIKNKSDFTIVSNYINDVSKSGLLKINGILLKSIIEKSKKNQNPGWVNSGIYIVERSAFDQFNKNDDFSFIVIPKLIKKKFKVCVYKTKSKSFFTIDSPKQLNYTRQIINF